MSLINVGLNCLNRFLSQAGAAKKNFLLTDLVRLNKSVMPLDKWGRRGQWKPVTEYVCPHASVFEDRTVCLFKVIFVWPTCNYILTEEAVCLSLHINWTGNCFISVLNLSVPCLYPYWNLFCICLQVTPGPVPLLLFLFGMKSVEPIS